MATIIFTFIKDLILILCEMAPYLLLGFFFAGLLYAFMPSRQINRYFNGKPLSSSVYAAIFGVPLPLCSCGVIPTGMSLYENGASRGSTVSFLISTPQTGMDSILATFSILGLPFAIIRPIVAFITGVTGGYITGKVHGEGKSGYKIKSIDDSTIESCALDNSSSDEHRSFFEKLKAAIRYGFVDFIEDISKWLTIGLILAAIVSVAVPDNFMSVVNFPPVVQMLLILLVSVPLYICATGSIPLAAVLIMKGLSPGAAFVLLMAGPATNMATITMIGKVMGKKTLVTYLATIISGALISGLIIDYVFPVSWFSGIMNASVSDMSMSSMVNTTSIVSGIVLAGLLLYSFIHKAYLSRKGEKSNNNLNDKTMNVKEFKVGGMMCNHCKANVIKGLENLDFVDNVTVDLAKKSVVVAGKDIDDEKVKETVKSLGYTVEE